VASRNLFDEYVVTERFFIIMNLRSHDERACRLLIGRDRTVGVGKCGFEMGENLGDRRAKRSVGWRPALRKCCANGTLSQAEPPPDALQSSPTEWADRDSNGLRDAVGNHLFQERPQRPRR
jgi:hypothetical protein